MAAEGIAFPETGTGARGRVNKSDLVQKLLSEVLGDTVSEEQRKRLARGLAREAAPEDLPTDMDDGSCPEEILNLLATMDPDNKDSFQKILEQATAILAERQRKKATSHGANPRAKPKDDADKPDDANPASSAAKPDDDATDKPDDAAPAAPPSDADAAGVVAPGGEPELLPARPHVGSDASRPRVSRKLTPDSLKCLLPPLSDDKVYLKWKSKASQIQVEFLGSLPVTSNLSLVPFAHPAGLGLCILHIGFSHF